ncbi:MAG: hypothetical protein ACR2JX_00805 [Mycobacteriales bacterium]
MTGIPYKIAAVTAPGVGIPMWLLALITPVVRLPRFVAAAAGGALLRRWTLPLSRRVRLSIVVTGWVLFYAATGSSCRTDWTGYVHTEQRGHRLGNERSAMLSADNLGGAKRCETSH